MARNIKKWFEETYILCVEGRHPNFNFLAKAANRIIRWLISHNKKVTKATFSISASRNASIIRLHDGFLDTHEIKILRRPFRSTDDYVKCVTIFSLLGAALSVYGLRASQKCPFNRLGIAGPTLKHALGNYNVELVGALRASKWLKEKSSM